MPACYDVQAAETPPRAGQQSREEVAAAGWAQPAGVCEGAARRQCERERLVLLEFWLLAFSWERSFKTPLPFICTLPRALGVCGMRGSVSRARVSALGPRRPVGLG